MMDVIYTIVTVAAFAGMAGVWLFCIMFASRPGERSDPQDEPGSPERDLTR